VNRKDTLSHDEHEPQFDQDGAGPPETEKDEPELGALVAARQKVGESGRVDREGFGTRVGRLDGLDAGQ